MMNIRSRLPNIHIELHPRQMLKEIREGIKNKTESVKSWFQTPAVVTPTLNSRFLEQIHVKRYPLSPGDFVVAGIIAVAGVTLIAYSITLWMTTAVITKTVGILGLSTGIGLIAQQVEKVKHASNTFKALQTTPEEKIWNEYKKYSNAEVAAKFKELTEIELTLAYTPAQVQLILKDTKASSLEQAILPMLIRFALKKAEYDESLKQTQIGWIIREENIEGGYIENRAYVIYESPVSPIHSQYYLNKSDWKVLVMSQKQSVQKIYMQKFETAFTLALLLHPDKLKQTSLSELGTLCDYSKDENFWMQSSELPFFFGKALNATHGIQSVRYREVKNFELKDLVALFITPKSLAEGGLPPIRNQGDFSRRSSPDFSSEIDYEAPSTPDSLAEN